MRIGSLALAALLTLSSVAPVLADLDVVVGDMDRPQHKWGNQILSVPVTNNTDYPKYIVVKAILKFQGSYLNPARGFRSNNVLYPGKSMVVGVPVEIPANYGTAYFTLSVYDVVDTLDALLASQKIMEQNAQMLFQIPEGIIPYMQERVTTTPMTDHNMYIGTEFARVMSLLLKEHKTVDQIAKMAGLEPAYVKSLQDTLLGWAYYGKSRTDSSVVPAFPVFTSSEADGIRPLVEKTSTSLAALITKNLPAYWRTLDSMVKGGGLARDSNDFINGGTCLYRVYPVVTALFLWYNLGQGIVGGTQPLDVYRDTDPCHAYITQYLYAVQGGDLVNGNQYYNYSSNTGRSVILFGDRIPTLTCPEDYPWKARLLLTLDYDYATNDKPEIFTFDTTLVNPALRALGTGVATTLKPSIDAFKAQVTKIGPDMYTQGAMLWFWNQVATRTTNKLIEQKVITRRNNGQYRFESLNGINLQ
jgi:hypothetical protein